MQKAVEFAEASPEPAHGRVVYGYLRRIDVIAGRCPSNGLPVNECYVESRPRNDITRNYMAKITMREAISQALMEEMDRDPAVFIMGEEVGVWGGTYAVTKGFYDKYGPERVKDTPIAENAIIGGGNRRGDGRPAPDRGTDDHQLRLLGDGLHRQPGAQTALHVRRTVQGPDGDPRRRRRRTPAWRDPLADAGCHLRTLPRPEGRQPRHAGRCQGTAQIGHPLGRPGSVHRTRHHVPGARRSPGGRISSSRSANPKSSAQARTSPSSPIARVSSFR
ncbi:MAG: hypothetical protein MZV64_23315 [Ignavibacteriales bacterium]|nr:hypothetical protein [Ignavibacteriales bacterium]